MADQRLLDYVKQQFERGMGRREIEKFLLAQGWQAPDINEAFNSSVSFPRPTTPNNAYSNPLSRPSAKGLKKILLPVIAIVGGALIVGGGAFAYFYYFQSPEKNIQKMIVKLAEIKSLEYSGELSTEINVGDLPGGNGGFLPSAQLFSPKKESRTSSEFSGSFDIQEANSPKGQFSFNLKTDALPLAELAFGAEAIMIDESFYVRLSDAPNLGLIDLSALKNQWIKINPKALTKQFDNNPLWEKQIAKAQPGRNLSPEQTKKLTTAFRQAKIFKITDKLAGEKIEGVGTHHYKFIIDEVGIKKFIIDSAEIIQGKTPTEEEAKAFDKGFESVGSLNGEIWIGKKDYLPRKLALNSTMRATETSMVSGKTNFTISFRNFNKPAQIEAPSETKPLEELLGGLFGGLKGFTPAISSPPVNRQGLGDDADADKDGLSDQREQVYGTDPNQADTDGDGFKDGDEVKNGYNPNGAGKLISQ